MALITRFTRLFKADLHAVLDRLEEPDVLLRQAIREMEDDVAQRGRGLKAREVERQQTEARIAAIARSLQDIGGELDLCFGAANEALARPLLRRRLEGERLLQRLERQRASLAAVIAEQATALDELRRRLESMRQRAAIFDADPVAAESAGHWGADDVVVSDADVDVALLRERQKRAAS